MFSYFGKKWLDREKDSSYPEPDANTFADVEGDSLPDIDGLDFEMSEADLPRAGAEAARERLNRLCESAIFEYSEAREYPTRAATSRLSQDLKYGTISIREVTERVEQALETVDGEAEHESVETFLEELAWREFYAQVTYYNPEVVVENYKEFENAIDWREDDTEFQAWKEGETGYPIVGAGMRQLRDEVYMHNRVRMVVASFSRRTSCSTGARAMRISGTDS